MAINRQLLKKFGFLYPTRPGELNHISLALYAAKPEAATDLRQAASLATDKAYAEFRRAHPMAIADEIAQSGCHTAVLSCEHCTSRLRTVSEIAKLRGLVAPLARECKVIVYLRRQDEIVPSLYSTAVKSGATHEFGFPQEIEWLDYLRLLDKWTQVFGQENILVRIFEAQQMIGKNLICDFFTTMGFTDLEGIVRPEDQNRSLDVHTVEFLRRFNMRVPVFTSNGINCARGYVDQALASITTRECIQPSGDAASAFLDQFSASNAEVARRFLNRPDGILFKTAPCLNQPERLPALDLDRAMAISAALWQWQEARLKPKANQKIASD
jgi:hypothetical protein